MTSANLSHFTSSGLRAIDRVPFGMHACHFYSNRDQLVAALVPYFAAGLRGNERCLWVTAPPLPARDAVQALRAAWDGVDDAMAAGALRVLDFDEWYTSSTRLKELDVVQFWLEEEESGRWPTVTKLFASPGIRVSSGLATGRRSWSTNGL